jgi:hypothetical protein
MKLDYTSDRNQTPDLTYQRGELITTQNVTAAYLYWGRLMQQE